MGNMETLSQAMSFLQGKGYVEDFNLKPDGLHCVTRQMDIEPDAFGVDAVYRFEGMSDPGDEEILFAVSSNKYKLKELLVNAYGLYADTLTLAMEQKAGYFRKYGSKCYHKNLPRLSTYDQS